MTNSRLTADTSPTAILSRNRDLALAEADVCEKNGYHQLEAYAQGQAQAYGEALRILAAARPAPVVESFRCGYVVSFSDTCGSQPANFVGPGGYGRFCSEHAPTDVDLTISNHDDARDRP